MPAVDDGLIVDTKHCPVLACRSTKIGTHDSQSPLAKRIAAAWGNKNACPIGQCLDCGAIWEAWPEGASIDCIEREPCDNCAYRAGSKESQDREEWARLVRLAKDAASTPLTIQTRPEWFSCHKGIPIRLKIHEDGQSSIEFDYFDAGIAPLDQTCSGFLRLMHANKSKGIGQ